MARPLCPTGPDEGHPVSVYTRAILRLRAVYMVNRLSAAQESRHAELTYPGSSTSALLR